MRKPNWKRRGLKKAETDTDRLRARQQREVEARVQRLPPELRQMVRENPSLLNSV